MKNELNRREKIRIGISSCFPYFTDTYGLFDNITKMTMTNLETEELLVGKRSEFIPSETDGGSLDAEFIPAGETTHCRVSEVPLAGVGDELTKTVQPTQSTTAEAPGNSTSIRWWDPLIIIVSAWLAWAMFWVLFGFVAGFYFAMRSGTEFDAFITAASQNFYVCQIANVSFYLRSLPRHALGAAEAPWARLICRLFSPNRRQAPFLCRSQRIARVRTSHCWCCPFLVGRSSAIPADCCPCSRTAAFPRPFGRVRNDLRRARSPH